jgi:hypothetical protein
LLKKKVMLATWVAGLVFYGSVGQTFALTYPENIADNPAYANWPNPNHYWNFIASGESCSSTHFTCERSEPYSPLDSLSTDLRWDYYRVFPSTAEGGSINSSLANKTAGAGGSGSSGGGGVGGGLVGRPKTSSDGDSGRDGSNGGTGGNGGSPKVSVVPLPNTDWLMLTSIFGLGILGYRKRSFI